jgi:hypothetical protein
MDFPASSSGEKRQDGGWQELLGWAKVVEKAAANNMRGPE